MPNLNHENTIMSSNDGSITLTTHRLLQRSRDLNKEILLSEFLSYEQVNRRNSYYKVLCIIFLVATIVLGFIYNNKHNESEYLVGRVDMVLHRNFGQYMAVEDQLRLYASLTFLSGVLFVISLILFRMSNKKILMITGRYSSIEFSTNHLRNESFSKFTNALITESDNRKRELSGIRVPPPYFG